VDQNENALEPDQNVLFALRHISYLLRCLWIKRPNTIYLVRHGERYDYTDFNWAPTATHPHDAPLSAAGQRQARDLVDRLMTIQPAIIAAAPMQRAIMGGDPLARTLGTSISVEPGFCEFLCSKTRKRVPGFYSADVSITPWVDQQYVPAWKDGLRLESWDDVYGRTATSLRVLAERCNGKGDLVVISHRSTLQTMMRAIMGPHWEGETKLEYGGMSMFIQEDEDEGQHTDHGPNFLPGKWISHSFNELNFLRDKIESPSSNPFRHIEGYYEDLEWGNYKSTAELWDTKETKA
jgi:broad specificity phosphatase PhoE